MPPHEPAQRSSAQACERALRALPEREVLQTVDNSAPLVTDAKNPLGQLQLAVAEEFHAAMAEMYPSEFWVR